VSINSRTRLAALGLVAVFAIGACGGGGSTASPSASQPAAESTAPESAAPGASEATTAGGPPECLSFADIYALVGPESEDVQTWDQAATIATELGSNTQFPAGLPIAITAPGEESGTFDSFVDVVLGDYLEEREQGDATTRLSNYQSSSDDNAIIDGIANSAGSFGWVGFAFYEENLDRVRAFTISADPNGTCVAPTAETIASNEYPISRDLFIYVNKAKLAENPAIAAYVDYYLADGTIDGVLETVPYVPLKPEVLAESRTAWETFKGSTAADPNGTVAVSGSSTVQPISNKVAEQFKAENSGFDFTVEGPGTGDGFAQFCAGELDIADASRPISEEEVALCADGGVEYQELKVAIDGIAVMTQK
jgi:ABC-type phosphate transport system substrate-binding protein